MRGLRSVTVRGLRSVTVRGLRSVTVRGLRFAGPRGLGARYAELVPVVVAVALGCGLASGTLILRDGVHGTDSSFAVQAMGRVDYVVRQPAYGSQNAGLFGSGPAVQEYMLGELRNVPGVASVTGTVIGDAQVVSPSGSLVGGPGSVNVGVSVPGQAHGVRSAAVGGLRLRRGRLPATGGEVVLDEATFDRFGYRLGQGVTVAFRTRESRFLLVGVVGVGALPGIPGGTLLGFTTAEAQADLGEPHYFTEIDVLAKPGAAGPALAARLVAAAGPGAEVLSAGEVVAASAAELSAGAAYLPGSLGALSLLSIIAGVFVVANSTSLSRARRERRHAVVRCIGASRLQVLAAVLRQAALTAGVSSVVGVGLGLLLARALPAMVAAFGVEAPMPAPVLTFGTFGVTVALGIAVTLASAMLPAVAAARRRPLDALRGDVENEYGAQARPQPGGRSWRLVSGLLVGVAGVAVLAAAPAAMPGSVSLGAWAFGSVLVAACATLVAPELLRRSARRSARRWSCRQDSAHRRTWTAARIGARNAATYRRSGAVASSALSVAIGLMSLSAVVASSLERTAGGIVSHTVRADFVVLTPTLQTFSPDLPERLARLRQLATVAAAVRVPLRVGGRSLVAHGIDASAWRRLVEPDVRAGDLAGLGDGAIALSATLARESGWHVGMRLPGFFPDGQEEAFRVGAVFGDDPVDGDVLFDSKFYARAAAAQPVSFALIGLRSGVGDAAARRAIAPVLASFPQVRLVSAGQFRSMIDRAVRGSLGLVVGVLAAASVAALAVIANSVSLTVLTRRRELATMRALGMTRRELTRMVRTESALIALGSVVAGVAGGVIAGWGLVRVLQPFGAGEVSVPLTWLAAIGLVALAAATLAAELPSRRAGRRRLLDMLVAE